MVDMGATGGSSADPVLRLQSQDLQSIRGEAPVARETEAPEGVRAVSRPEAGEEAQASRDGGGEVAIDEARAFAGRLNELAEISGRSLRFRLDGQDAGLNQIQVVDSSSGDIVKNIPADELLAVRRRMRETVGVILDEMV